MTSTVEDQVNEMLDPKTFDIGDFLKSGGMKLPRSEFILPTDGQAAIELTDVREQLAELPVIKSGTLAGDTVDNERIEELEKQQKELINRLYESRIVLHLRGLTPAEIKAMSKKADAKAAAWKKERTEPTTEQQHDDYRNEWFNTEFIAASIEKIEFPLQGAEQIKIDHATVDTVLESVSPEMSNAIAKAVNELTFTRSLVDVRTDAGFLSRRTDTAKE